jgi:enamine deaminase RidA (YjgF/YER057c/UK114 family)
MPPKQSCEAFLSNCHERQLDLLQFEIGCRRKTCHRRICRNAIRITGSLMKVERHEVGPRMSQIVIHGDTVYLAGIVAQNSGGKSVTEQTKEILATIDGYLARAGTDKSKLLTANIWLANMDTFAEMNAVWDAWVSPGNTPARATVQARLAAPQFTVEIMVTAAK